ncbi:MAG TPA: hypothetical protein VF063_09695 [Gaiellaceae bacterium]
MSDPFTSAGIAIGKVVGPKLIEWAQGGEAGRLQHLLGDELGATTGLSAAGLTPLWRDTNFLVVLLALIQTDAFDVDALAGTIEPHVGPTGHWSTPRETAEHVAREIYRLLPRAKKGAEGLHDQFDRLTQEVRVAAQPQYVPIDWAPPLAREKVRALAKANAMEADELRQAIGDSPTRKSIERLLQPPQSWLASGSRELWEAVAELGFTYGAWDVAEHASVKAADLAGAEVPRLLARAAQAARFRSDSRREAELLEDARRADPKHVAIAFAEATAIEEPKKQLVRLKNVKPRRAADKATVELLRASAHLALRDVVAAKEALARAKPVAAPGSPMTRQVEALAVLVENQERLLSYDRTDVIALGDAARELLKLRDEFRELARYDESSLVLSQAALAYFVAGERGRAADLLDEVRPRERSQSPARLTFARIALDVGRPDLIGQFLPTRVKGDEVTLLRAKAAIAAGDASSRKRAMATARRLLRRGDELVRLEAARTLLITALDYPDVPWDDEAEALLNRAQPTEALVLKAESLTRAGRATEAENLLLPYADEKHVLRTLIDLAIAEREWDKAIGLFERLFAQETPADDRLVFAQVLNKAGRRRQAGAQLVELRSRASVPTSVRRSSFALSAMYAAREERFVEVASVTGEWLSEFEHDQDASWARVQALARLGRWEEAFELTRTLEPRRLEEAALEASVLHRAAKPLVAVRRIVELSDQYERPENLEALVISASMRLRERPPEDLRARIGETWAQFPERFPQSAFLQAFKAPESQEEVLAFIQEHFARDQTQLAEVSRRVMDGETAVAALAGVVGRDLAYVWGRLTTLPLGYSDPALEQLEEADAAAAIGSGAVWDSGAIFVAGGLGGQAADSIRKALPTSIVPQSVLDDINHAADVIEDDQGSGRREISLHPVTHEPLLHEWSQEEVVRERTRAKGMLELARKMPAVADVDPANPTPLDEYITDPLRSSFQTWPATIAVAQRLEKPIYSDDRFIRLQARREGLPAFGTLAILNALVQREQLSQEERERARLMLLSSGAHGVRPTFEEIHATAAANDYRPVTPLLVGLLDPGPWRLQPVQVFRKYLAVLRRVHAERPDELRVWTARILDAAKSAWPSLAMDHVARVFLIVAWEPWEPSDDPFIRALIAALQELTWLIPSAKTLVVRALKLLLETLGTGETAELATWLYWGALRALELPDQLQILHATR